MRAVRYLNQSVFDPARRLVNLGESGWLFELYVGLAILLLVAMSYTIALCQIMEVIPSLTGFVLAGFSVFVEVVIAILLAACLIHCAFSLWGQAGDLRRLVFGLTIAATPMILLAPAGAVIWTLMAWTGPAVTEALRLILFAVLVVESLRLTVAATHTIYSGHSPLIVLTVQLTSVFALVLMMTALPLAILVRTFGLYF